MILMILLCSNASAQYISDTSTYPVDTSEVTVVEEPQEEAVVDSAIEPQQENIHFIPIAEGVSPSLTDSLQVRSVTKQRLAELRSDRDFWYVDYRFEKEREQRKRRNTAFTDHPLFQGLLWLLIIVGFVGFVILYLANSNVGIFRKTRSIDIEGEEGGTEDIFSINYQREIDRATAAKDYRLAIRLMFLRLLRSMSDKQVIQYQSDRTNFDYLLQLSSTPWYRDFFQLTRHYEYSWYGQFSIDEGKFGVIRKEFENFDRKLN